ncbi:hypothetical protein MKZ07_14555 [Paenibacillus sp. FSL P4-0338]|uniref:hypothetical protein n=1 Tax=Paenibacillus sp. FSL P4-0338 TaxID=2921635 RepID=UPI0030FC1C11
MKLEYKGVNDRGRAEWVDKDLTSSWFPEGKPLEEWHLLQYRPFVEEIQATIGRELTKPELETIHWLSGYEKDTISNIMGLIKEGRSK